jgi:class 3 adenylate cyclase/streptogramin lyase
VALCGRGCDDVLVPDPGLVAIMHVDVEGSTALATSAGDEIAHRVLAETKELVRERTELRGGREIDAVGDAMMLTFGSARAAIGAATDIQEALADREGDRPDETLRVRIGINVGEVLTRDGHPFGAAVNAGARVMAKAQGGEILVSELAHGLAGTIPGVTFRDRGRHVFKGFDTPWRLYQVVWPGAPAPRARQRRRVSRRLVLTTIASTAVLGGLVATIFLLTRPASKLTVPPNSVGVIDPRTNAVVHAIPVGNTPSSIVTGLGEVWAVNVSEQTLSVVDPQSLSATTIGSLVQPTSVAVGAGSVWVAGADQTLSRIDPATRAVAGKTPLRGRPSPVGTANPNWVAAGRGQVWATAPGRLFRIRPRPETINVTGCCGPLVVARGAVWAVTPYGLAHVDPVTRNSITVQLSFEPSSVAFGAGSVWVTDTNGNALWRINPGTDQPEDSVHIPHPVAVAVGGGAVWVASTDGTVVRVNPNSSPPLVQRTLKVGGTPAGLTFGEGRIWVTVN